MAGSAVVMVVMAALIYTGAFGISEQSRVIVAGALGVAGVLDIVLAIYFIVSEAEVCVPFVATSARPELRHLLCSTRPPSTVTASPPTSTTASAS